MIFCVYCLLVFVKGFRRLFSCFLGLLSAVLVVSLKG